MSFKANLTVVRFLSVVLLLILTGGIATAQQVAYNYMPAPTFRNTTRTNG